MESLTSKSSRWLRKTTVAGMIPLLLAQVLIALAWVPQTLEAGPETRREMTWEQLPAFLESEKKVTVVLTEGGAVRSEGVTALSDSIHLGHIVMATNLKRYPWGSEASIARGSVREIRLEKMRGNLRRIGAVGFGAAGFFFGPGLVGARKWGGRVLAGWLVGSVGGAGLGYWLGMRKDRETTIITIVN